MIRFTILKLQIRHFRNKMYQLLNKIKFINTYFPKEYEINFGDWGKV